MLQVFVMFVIVSLLQPDISLLLQRHIEEKIESLLKMSDKQIELVPLTSKQGILYVCWYVGHCRSASCTPGHCHSYSYVYGYSTCRSKARYKAYTTNIV